MAYEAVLGLEVHIQLATRAKLFCACPNEFAGEPNTRVCPVCLGLPGSLPVLNRAAVEGVARLGLALGATVHERSIFARKNYFYPDMPKNYQISQYDEPLVTGGALDIGTSAAPHAVPLTRIHLEEDTGKSFHPERHGDREETRLDFNRAGVPLAEMVSEPALRTPEEAFAYLTTLRRLVRWLGISDGDMEKGSLRCDANVSLRPVGETKFGTRTEIKNLNSIAGVKNAIAAEIERQRGVLESGGRIEQATLLWDQDKERLQVMRSKEEAHDYRYFPEPDLPPLTLAAAEIEALRRALPELPLARSRRFESALGLPAYDADLLTDSRDLASYFEETVEAGAPAKAAANRIGNDVLRTLKENGQELASFREVLPPVRLAALLGLASGGTLSSKLARELFTVMLKEPGAPEELAKKHGLVQESDAGALSAVAEKVLEANPSVVADFLGGKEKALTFLVGQLMKETKGRANPQVAQELLREALARRAPAS
ncbi:MAG: Asp-tRNA(Asn)/Glu-tRNA(Gln) amidotransferase subunit GatB [Candidatus Eiseniibacteriota bacterium]